LEYCDSDKVLKGNTKVQYFSNHKDRQVTVRLHLVVGASNTSLITPAQLFGSWCAQVLEESSKEGGAVAGLVRLGWQCIPRSLNQLWTNGDIVYAPPVR
jgi:hypothetical protein